jgi:hypothetical protein
MPARSQVSLSRHHFYSRTVAADCAVPGSVQLAKATITPSSGAPALQGVTATAAGATPVVIAFPAVPVAVLMGVRLFEAALAT